MNVSPQAFVSCRIKYYAKAVGSKKNFIVKLINKILNEFDKQIGVHDCYKPFAVFVIDKATKITKKKKTKNSSKISFVFY